MGYLIPIAQLHNITWQYTLVWVYKQRFHFLLRMCENTEFCISRHTDSSNTLICMYLSIMVIWLHILAHYLFPANIVESTCIMGTEVTFYKYSARTLAMIQLCIWLLPQGLITNHTLNIYGCLFTEQEWTMHNPSYFVCTSKCTL